MLAGNRLGKTHAGSMEGQAHLTGRYDDFKWPWEGRVFRKPIRMWAAGITNVQTRDAAQRVLFGPKGAIGTGAIPLDAIVDISYSRVIADFIDTAVIRHVTGGVSHIAMKAYEQAKQTASKASPWGGDEIDVMWFDEEPPPMVYSEGLARIASTGGIAYITATPLLGMTEVVSKFYPEPDERFRHLVMMDIMDAEHIPVSRREEIIKGYSAHERESRVNGVPMLGSGRVFSVMEEMIKEPAIENIPRYWPRLGGIDFGWDHPTACVWGAYDQQNDVLHITNVYRQSEQTPVVHAAAMKAGGQVEWAWPHDGAVHDKQTGDTLAMAYRKQGVRMLNTHATFRDGGNHTEVGVMEMLDRMLTGRLKVASHLTQWFEEYRMYHRKDGNIVPVRDDLLDATRYLMMMLRYAKPDQKIEYQTQVADYNPFDPPGRQSRGRPAYLRN